MTVFRAHWLAPWFNHPFLATELTEHGLLLHLKGEQQPLAWHELNALPHIEPGRRLYRLRLLCTQQGVVELGWLPKSVAEELQHAITLSWYRYHSARILPLAQSCLALLEEGYLRDSRWQQLQSMLQQEPLDWSQLSLPCGLSDQETAAFELVATLMAADDEWREQCCDDYCEQMLAEYAELFDTLERHPLTPAQRLACVIDEEHNLVLAGAGCGKTSVMMARAAFLLASQQAQAEQLLLLAFGNGAAAEMTERLAKNPDTQGVEASTFHALGLMIITRATGKRPIISALAQQESARIQQVASWLCELVATDPDYQAQLEDWLRHHRFQLVPEPDYQRVAREWLPMIAALKLHGEPPLESLTSELASQLALIQPLLARYQQHLAQHNEIDFDDMIEQATELVHLGRFKVPWRYILVDEFQDISAPRAALLQALKNAAPELSLFCVGDDWQAIYRFSGADVSLTTQFAHYFGASRITCLDQTFRFNNQIEQVASRFVTRNPEQIPKKLATLTRTNSPCVHVLPVESDSQMDAIARILGQIAADQPEASVYIVARFRFSLPDATQLRAWQRRFEYLQVAAQTLHGAKGKEADHVIMMGLSRGKYGFPPEKNNTALLEALLPIAETFPYAEERRLFYVGLTRARQQVYLLTDPYIPSVFINELLQGGYPNVSRWHHS